MSDIYQEALALHAQKQGKLEIHSKVAITNRHELALSYTPGVAAVSRAVAEDKDRSYELTMRGRTVAVISDGSAVLGLGNIGPEAAMPVMEGKSLLMKEFAGVDSIPLVINAQSEQDIINFVKQVAQSFAGINLEDITAPRCFIVEDALQEIGIPVFHDDQHGTAIVITAALHNAAKVVGKKYEDLKVVIVGAGAAGLATARMLMGVECSSAGCQLVDHTPGVHDTIVIDSQGAIVPTRPGLNIYKQALSWLTNKEKKEGSLEDVIDGADVLIGVSKPGLITPEIIKKMADKPIVFAMANPEPEIMPDLAKEAGAAVVATGRSDFPNQINNVLAFPAIFKAVVDGRLTQITTEHKARAAQAIAELVPEPKADNIIPDPFTPGLAEYVSQRILGKS